MRLFSAVLCALTLLPAGLATRSPAPAPQALPTLVVILVIDQMRADYLQRHAHQWRGGFRRLMDDGAWFENAQYPYLNTVTCASHATISTGAFPRTHGITGNSWLDRATGRTVECADDAARKSISYGRPVDGAKGPAQLDLPTFTDDLRAQAAVAPRIVTFSMKERTAIMLAGHRATAATWYDPSSGSLVTSSAYTATPVPFIERYVKAHPIDADLARSWTLQHPPAFYASSDDTAGEQPPSFWTRTFPHALKHDSMKAGQPFEAWEESPFSDIGLERLGEAAIDALKLGSGPGTDVLGISFSALDLVGHDFGPDSVEVQDLLLRLDATLGRFFDALDQRVGRSRYVVALTADHGVSGIPEQMLARGVPAGRIPTAAISTRIEETLRPALGTAKAVMRTMGGQVYLTAEARQAIERDARLRRSLVASVGSIPGVARVLLGDERERWDVTDPLARAAAFAYFAGRVGDVFVIPQPNWLFGSGSAATHGTSYRYDAWVPLFLYGKGIKAGRYAQAVSPADIAPTLAWLCAVTLTHPDGRPLLEALAPAATRRGGTGRPSRQ